MTARPYATAAEWLNEVGPRAVQLAAEGRAEDEAHYDAEARARLLAYKRVTCTGETWDRMLGLLELARDNLRHTECRDGDATRCPSCGLEAEIDDMLKDAR